MVDYLYKLSEIDDTHEAYTANGKVVASASILGLWKDCPPVKEPLGLYRPIALSTRHYRRGA